LNIKPGWKLSWEGLFRKKQHILKMERPTREKPSGEINREGRKILTQGLFDGSYAKHEFKRKDKPKLLDITGGEN